MNIVHIVFSFTNGGIENLLVDIMNNWSREDNLLLCVVNDNVNEELIRKIECSERRQVICMQRTPGGKKIPYLKQLEGILEEFRADIIHCHSNNVFKFILPIKIMHPSLKLFYTVHDTNLYKNLKPIDCLLHRVFLEKIFAISKIVKEEIVSKNIDSKKVEVVYNGVDIKKFLPKQKAPHGKKEIVCVARLVPPKKGQDILIRAIKEISMQRNDFICRLVGGIPTEENNYLEEINKLIKELGVEDYIELVGDCDDVPRVLSTADIFVLPSRYEGFGIAVIEAMLSRTVVVATDIDGPREIIQDNKYGYLFHKEDYLMLSMLLHNLLETENITLVKEAYEYALHQFSIENMVSDMKKGYN